MKTFILPALLALSLAAGMLLAEDKAPTTQKSEPVNKLCPVTDEKIDPAVTIDYEGKTIAFCCADCIKDFKKDPKKYLAKMK